MMYAAGAVYVRKAFNQVLLCVRCSAQLSNSEWKIQASKNVTQEMISDLQEAFREMVLMSNWMDTKTKASALDKANHMLRQIAYPDFILNDKKLDDYYSGFTVQASDSYSEMVGNLSRWDLEYRFKRLIKPVDRNEFEFNSAIERRLLDLEFGIRLSIIHINVAENCK
ncbi:hypothetical protein ANCDUO_04160 [Ancylostoma duodenale]|uniref:Peptidase M13 N-terminal domain-containing protein n=1 Tax=Ancylostoma duodenale TaxID=51022 RepID=A0A0C2DRX5_9BILA|nr:hypothetical protein ANCDUO_04160 [Ancylostoma duodenale]